MENKRSFYAILPAYVRYDSDLSSTSKLIYAEITALCNERGYCWATNKYFSELFTISIRQVPRILNQLVEKSYIKIVIENQTKRKIYLTNTHDKNVMGGMTKMSGVHDKNVTHNNINNNKNEYDNNQESKDDYIPLFNCDWLGKMMTLENDD